MGTSMIGNVTLDFARTFDDRELLVLLAIVVATILIDSELGVVSDPSNKLYYIYFS